MNQSISVKGTALKLGFPHDFEFHKFPVSLLSAHTIFGPHSALEKK